jgi:hypothetical protein
MARDNHVDFITKDEWPSSTPEFNASDYSIWSILEAKACAKSQKIVESLKRALIKAWKEIPLETLRKVIDDFLKRLEACIEAQGGYFE